MRYVGVYSWCRAVTVLTPASVSLSLSISTSTSLSLALSRSDWPLSLALSLAHWLFLSPSLARSLARLLAGFLYGCVWSLSLLPGSQEGRGKGAMSSEFSTHIRLQGQILALS